MNMQGMFGSRDAFLDDESPSRPYRIWKKVVDFRYFLLLVVVPSLLVTGYYYLIAADQYESEAHFIVSAGGASSPATSGFGALLGLGGVNQSQSQMMSLPDYLTSHDAVERLRRRIDLVRIFDRPEADRLSRISTDNLTPESLLKYYNSKVDVRFDRDTGITQLKVRAFRPQDSYVLAQSLLQIGEQQVNAMNTRSYTDAVAMARRQMREAEAVVASIQNRITAFRQTRRDIDPQASGESQIRLVSQLQANLAAAQSQLQTMGALISHSSPQYIALQRQVRSLQAGVAAQSSTLTGGSAAIASNLGGYEDLRVRQEFAGKQYDAAAANLAKAREDAQRQQLYLVRVVDANRPVKSLYPQRGKIVLTTILALCLAYGIGWLIVAGVKEHAA